MNLSRNCGRMISFGLQFHWMLHWWMPWTPPPKRRNIPSSAAYWSLSRASRPCRRERPPIVSIRTSTRSNTVYGGSKKRAFSLISVPHKRANGYALRPHTETAAQGHSSFGGGFSFYALCTNFSQISVYAASTSRT